VVTQHVKANLFYRGLAFRRVPRLGDTLRTSTRVVALRQNQPREGRAPTGLAVLRITTVDQQRRPVLDFWRCAMLPLRDQAGRTGRADDFDSAGQSPAPGSLQTLPSIVTVAALRPGPEPADPCRPPDASAKIFILDSILYVAPRDHPVREIVKPFRACGQGRT
jgi:hypothetical protein